MDENQKKVCQLAIDGHNLLLTGDPGSGKTYTMCKMLEGLLANGKKVTILTSTGIAGFAVRRSLSDHNLFHYSDIVIQTVHRFFGLLDGRYTNEKLLQMMNTYENFAKHKDKILDLECLFIDEVSMLSTKIFHQV